MLHKAGKRVKRARCDRCQSFDVDCEVYHESGYADDFYKCDVCKAFDLRRYASEHDRLAAFCVNLIIKAIQEREGV